MQECYFPAINCPFQSFRNKLLFVLIFGLMKIFFLLLGASMLCISWFVCPDNWKGAVSPEIMTTGAGSSDQQHDQEEKSCCPFYNCSCYANENFKPQDFFFPKLIFADNVGNSRFLYSEIAEVILPIWHPPQFIA